MTEQQNRERAIIFALRIAQAAYHPKRSVQVAIEITPEGDVPTR